MLLYLMNKDGTSKAGGGRVGDPLNRPTTIPEIPTGYIAMHAFSATFRSVNVCVPTRFDRCQALVINMELYGVGAEVLKATECHCKGQKYRPPKQLTTPAVKPNPTLHTPPPPPHTHTHTHNRPASLLLYSTARIHTQTQDCRWHFQTRRLTCCLMASFRSLCCR